MPDRQNNFPGGCGTNQPALVFLGVRFVLFGFDPPDYAKYRDEIVRGGGIDVGRYDSTCTHVIVDQLTRDHPVCAGAWRDGKIVVTKLWVEHSANDGKLADTYLSLHMPVKDMNGIPGARQLVICLTGYQKKERSDIEAMVELMGAEFIKALEAKRATHLICYRFEGEKYDLAKKFGVKLVNHRWLEDSLKAWDVLPEDEYSKSSWELEIMDAEAQDSEEETETKGRLMLAQERNLGTNNRNWKMNNTSARTVALGEVCQVGHIVNAVQGSLSTSTKVPANDTVFSSPGRGTPGKASADVREPGKMLSNQSVGVSSVAGNDITAFHILERSAIAGNENEKVVGLNGVNIDIYEIKVPDETLCADASGKGSTSLSCSRALKKSTVSCSPKAPSTGLNTLRATQIDKESVSEQRDQLSIDKINLRSADVVSPSREYVEKTTEPTKCKAADSELAGCYGVSVHEPMLRLNCFDGNVSNLLTVPSAKTAEDAQADPSMKKLLSFKRKSLKRHIASLASSIDETDSPVRANVAGLHEHAVLATSSDRMDVANMFSLEYYENRSEGSLELDGKKVAVKSLGFTEAEYMFNQENNNASKLSVYLGTHEDGTKEPGVSEGSPSSNHKFSFENCQNDESAKKCSNGNADIKECSTSSYNRLTKRLTVKNFASRNSLNVGNPLKPKLDLNSSDITNEIRNNVKEGQGTVVPATMGETQTIEKDLVSGSAIPKSQHVYKRNGLSITQKPSKKLRQSAKVLDECNTKDIDIERAKNKDQNSANENHQSGQSAPNELANKENGAGLERIEERKNIKMDPASNEDNSKHEGSSNGKSGVLKPSNKLKQKSEVVDGNDMIFVDKENQNKANQQHIDAYEKQTSKKIVSKAKKLKDMMHADKENRNKVNQQQSDDNEKLPSKMMVSKANKVNAQNNSNQAKNGSRGMKISRVIQFEPRWFILSGHRFQRKEFQQAIKCLQGRVCRDSHQWCYQATHFIVPEPVRRTEKLFAAAAAGRWILKTDYLTSSSQAGKFLEEEPFEWYKNGLSLDGAVNLEAPRKWRLLRQRTGHGAFYGMKIIIYGECIAPSLDTMKRVVKAGDGTILATSPPYHRFLNSGVDFAIVSPSMHRTDAWIREFIAHEVPCVLADYLVEFVCKPGYSLDRHVLYNMHAVAEQSHSNLLKKLEQVVKVPLKDDEIVCSVCHSRDREEVMLICGDDAGKAGCGLAMHIDCCDPPIKSVPEDDWFCSKCNSAMDKNGDKAGSVLKAK